MPNENTSVLAQKIKTAAVNAGAFPDLSDFAAAVAKGAGAGAAELLQLDCEASHETRVASVKDVLASRPDPGVNYWLTDDRGAPAMLVSIAPQFSAGLTTRLLGADFSLPQDEAPATLIDFEMAGSLVDLLTPMLNDLIRKASPAPQKRLLAGKRGARLAKDAMGEAPLAAVCEIAISFKIGEIVATKALSFSLPAAFAERVGLARRKAALAPDADAKAAWAGAMKRNLLNTELALGAVVDRISTNVGELSRLQVGQIIDLDPNALSRIEITAASDAGPVTVAAGKLGGYKTRKAVKLATGIDPDFLRGL
jgi:flagellar motor switch protein FliM